MVANKHITKIVFVIMALAVALCLLAITMSDKLNVMLGGTGVTMEYETKLFDTDEIISIDIQMDEEEWEEMLANSTSEEYYVCDVVINGQTVRQVAIRPKGNTSLSAIAKNPDSDRYSLKLEFDHFVEGQTCFGLDKLILNNNYADATNMKEAIIYDMFRYIGADASLYNYATVSLNGEYRGVYLALEGVEDSFFLRNYGTQDGELYKPDSMEMGGKKMSGFGGGFPGGNFGGKSRPSSSRDTSTDSKSADASSGSGDVNSADSSGSEDANNTASSEASGQDMPAFGDFDPSNMPQMGDFDPSNMPQMGDFDSSNRPEMPGGGKGGFSMGGSGANLNYTDDDLDSYSTIWDGEITETSKGDHRRVVTALKNISEDNDLEKYMDVDNILKYMAVHTFSVNMDSLSGTMAHNYYLYEYDGQLNIFPWDYNLSLGGMTMGSSGATDMVNDAIDTPFQSTEFFDTLLENEEYLAKYHEYLNQLVEEYVYGGRFEEVYNRIRSQIDSLVDTDPTAFYSYDEYDAAAETLYETIQLRAESIRGQLDGTIPSTDDGQKQDSSNLVDASHIDVTIMGQFDMGGAIEKMNASVKGESTDEDSGNSDSGTTGSGTDSDK